MKSRMSGSTRLRGYRGRKGFTLIEVMVAVLILAFGLLGFALLQTMNLRFTQSANQRTQATNLAYDLLDQMRANRFQASWYRQAAFAAGEVNPGTCSETRTGQLSVQDSADRWKCQVVRTLGADAAAQVTYSDGLVSVAISWNDERVGGDTAVSDDERLSAFTMTTRL